MEIQWIRFCPVLHSKNKMNRRRRLSHLRGLPIFAYTPLHGVLFHYLARRLKIPILGWLLADLLNQSLDKIRQSAFKEVDPISSFLYLML